MKLSLKNGKNNGYYITVTIGKQDWTSYWEAPPKSVDHVGIRYLKDRYPIIRTPKRVEKFKELYKDLIKKNIKD